MKAGSIKIFLIYAMLCFIWGSTWLAIRFGLETLTPLYSAGIRFTLAAFFILILMKIRGVRLQLDKISIRLYLVMGFLSFVIPFGLVYWAEQFVPSGMASVLFAVFPFFVAIFSFLFIANDSLDIFKISGIVIGFTGIVIIFSDSFGGDITDYLIGMFAIVLSAIMQAGIVTTIKKYGHHLNPLSMNFVPMLIAGISMFLIGLAIEDTSKNSFGLNAVLSILYLAFFGSVITFTSYYWLLKKINIVILSLIAFITPIVALILGFLIYDEQLSTNDFVGSTFVLFGVFGANLGNLIRMRKKAIIKEDG
jgi:drug/metabolite transporter (DMT)-like permease